MIFFFFRIVPWIHHHFFDHDFWFSRHVVDSFLQTFFFNTSKLVVAANNFWQRIFLLFYPDHVTCQGEDI